MEPTDFPPNSEASKGLTNQPRVQKVAVGEVKKRKKSLRKQFAETFVGGDMKTAVRYAIFDIFLPGARDTVLEVLQGGLDKLFLGDGRRRGYGGVYRQSSSEPIYQQQYQYNRMYGGGPLLSGPARALSRAARQRHTFDELLMESRSEAEDVITQMFEVMNHYGTVTVADLYDLVGLAPTHTDHKWGWTQLRGAGVSRTDDGYLLDLPSPNPID